MFSFVSFLCAKEKKGDFIKNIRERQARLSAIVQPSYSHRTTAAHIKRLIKGAEEMLKRSCRVPERC
jgi:hypothetical protein